jgi:hypothetical protein
VHGGWKGGQICPDLAPVSGNAVSGGIRLIALAVASFVLVGPNWEPHKGV